MSSRAPGFPRFIAFAAIWCLTSLVSAEPAQGAASPVVARGARPAPEETSDSASEPFLGRWELLILNTGSSFRAGALVVERDGQALRGELVWRWGSAGALGSDAFRVAEDGALLVKRGDFKQPIVLRAFGHVLEGTHEQDDGTTFHVVAIPAEDTVDASGTWDVVSVDASGGEHHGRLEIDSLGAGKIRARAYNREGDEIPLSTAETRGEELRLVLVPPSNDGSELRLEVRALVKGDRLDGHLATPSGEKMSLTAKRRRAWGEPQRLLAENSTAGWRPRDHTRSFGWKVTDGVLANSPPDVDIVSEAEFDDFRMSLEYRFERDGDHRANSGVYLRGRYELQILDDWESDPARRIARPHGNGAIYSRLAAKKNATGAPGTWQKYEITLIGRYLTVVLNGVTLFDNERIEGITGGALLPFESRPGPLMLQGDHGKIEYRNIVVTPALRP